MVPQPPQVATTTTTTTAAAAAAAAPDTTSSATSATSARKGGFPEALKEFVRQAYAQCQNGAQKDDVEKQLKAIINAASANGTLYSRNWTAVTPPKPAALPVAAATAPAPKRARMSSSIDPKVKTDMNRINERLARFANSSSSTVDGNSTTMKSSSSATARNKPTSKAARRAERRAAAKKGNKIASALSSYPAYLTSMGFGDVNGGGAEGHPLDWPKIQGCNQVLEKDFLRLTKPPAPKDVRPEPVLKAALKHIKAQYRASAQTGKPGYKWFWSQLKSIRQDLRVQHLRSKLTVQVYETHARIALEHGDASEFHQCQTQLAALYEHDVPGGHPLEFLGYRILYDVHSGASTDLIAILGSLTEDEASAPGVAHALEVRASASVGNYIRFFKLYQTAPDMGGWIMDLMVPRERRRALRIMLGAYRPTLPVAVVNHQLGFEDEAKCRKFLAENSAVYAPDGTALDCKASIQAAREAAAADKND